MATGTDINYTETTTADFLSGTLSQVTAINNELTLYTSTNVNQTFVDTTDADFNGRHSIATPSASAISYRWLPERVGALKLYIS